MQARNYVSRFPDRRYVAHNFYMDIGRAIDTLRIANGWNKKELAERSGINEPNLNRIISGQQNPTMDRLQQLADAFGCAVYEIIRLAETGKEADARKALLHRLVDEMTAEQIENAFRRMPDSDIRPNKRSA